MTNQNKPLTNPDKPPLPDVPEIFDVKVLKAFEIIPCNFDSGLTFEKNALRI